MNPFAGEAAASTGVFAGAAACTDCLMGLGMDPTVAGTLAVLLAVGVRTAVTLVLERRARARRETETAEVVARSLAEREPTPTAD